MSTGEDCAALREKYWGELSQEEKIERLASLLYSSIYRRDAVQSDLHRLCTHSHLPNGEIAVPMKNLGLEVRGGRDYNYDMLQRKKD